MMKKLCLLSACTLLALVSCHKTPAYGPYPGTEPGGGSEENPSGVPGTSVLNLTDISQLNQGASPLNSHAGATGRSSMMMNYRTYSLLGSDVTGVDMSIYPRMYRNKAGELFVFFHKKEGTSVVGNRTLLISTTDMKTYKNRGEYNIPVATVDDYGTSAKRAFADCFPLQLKNGDVITVSSYRIVGGTAGKTYRDNQNSAGIAIRRSTKDGFAWDTAHTPIHTGVNWEPFLLQLSNGDIHCYFTDSHVLLYDIWTGVYNSSGTALIVSKDNGQTWSDPVPVVRYLRDQSGSNYLFTDQMPSVIELNGSTQLAGAFEADKSKGGASADYYISLAYSNPDGSWPALADGQQGPADKQNFVFKGSAPYLVQFPSGETLLSYNEASYFKMRMGDETARSFGNPFVAFSKSGYYWGALYLDTPHSVIGAIGGSAAGMNIASFVLNHDIRATKRTPNVDAVNSDWAATDEALFVGSRSTTQTTLRCSADADNLYLLCECKDESLSVDDYISVYLTPAGKSTLDASARMVSVGIAGLKSQKSYNGSAWADDENPSVVVKTALDGTPDDAKDKDNGWLAEIAIPRSYLGGGAELLVNLALGDKGNAEDAIAPTATKSTNNWIKLSL